MAYRAESQPNNDIQGCRFKIRKFSVTKPFQMLVKVRKLIEKRNANVKKATLA